MKVKENLIIIPKGVYKVGDIVGNEMIIHWCGIYSNFGEDAEFDVFFTKKIGKLKAAMYNVLKET